MNEYLKSAPHLFGPVKRAAFACVVALALMAAAMPAPLDVAADAGHPPNPAKSAWFLLWIQELVSHSTLAIYAVLALAVLLVALPWLPWPPAERAAWFQPRLRAVTLATLAIAAGIVTLTLVGMWCRGPNWTLALPF